MAKLSPLYILLQYFVVVLIYCHNIESNKNVHLFLYEFHKYNRGGILLRCWDLWAKDSVWLHCTWRIFWVVKHTYLHTRVWRRAIGLAWALELSDVEWMNRGPRFKFSPHYCSSKWRRLVCSQVLMKCSSFCTTASCLSKFGSSDQMTHLVPFPGVSA